MDQKDLISALQNERRQQVDFNLGQVPINPVVGKMGNYNVIVPGYTTDNTAKELSKALAQVPQLTGQARAIQEKAGLDLADELTTEEVLKRFEDNDLEAGGFLSQLGKDKAFAEGLYNRVFEAKIRPSFISVSREIDEMPVEDLAALGTGDTFKKNFQSRLVNAISSGGNENLLENIKGNRWQAILHNKAMEAFIPRYTEEALQKVDARRRDFTRRQNEANLPANFLSEVQNMPSLNLENVPEEEQENVLKQFRDTQTSVFLNAFSNSYNTAVANGVDKLKAESLASTALRTYLAYLAGTEQIEHIEMIKDSMEDGTLKYGDKQVRRSTEGLNVLTFANDLIRNYEDQLKREDPIDKPKMDNFLFDKLVIPVDRIIGSSPSNADIETGFDNLNALREEINALPPTEFNISEKTQMLARIDKARIRLEAEQAGVTDTSDIWLNSRNARAIKDITLLSNPATQKKLITPNAKALEDAGVTAAQYRKHITTKHTASGPITDYSPEIIQLFSLAAEGAVAPTLSPLLYQFDLDPNSVPLKRLDDETPEAYNIRLSAFQDNVKKSLEENYSKELKRLFDQLVPPVEEVDTPEVVVDPEAETQAAATLRRTKAPVDPDNLGKIKIASKFRNVDLIRDMYPEGVVTRSVEQVPDIDTEATFNLFNPENPAQLDLIKSKNTVEERQQLWDAMEYALFQDDELTEKRAKLLANGGAPAAESLANLRAKTDIFGVPYNVLMNDGIKDIVYYPEGYANQNFLWPWEFFSKKVDPNPIRSAINFNSKDRLKAPEAPSTIFFNADALKNAVAGNHTMLARIAVKFGHATGDPRTITPENNAQYKALFEGQKSVAIKNGFLDPETKKPVTEEVK